MKKFLSVKNTCFQCAKEVIESEASIKFGSYGLMHEECHKELITELKAQEEKETVHFHKDRKNTKRILRKLKKKLKPKIWEWINFEIHSHNHSDLKILYRNEFKGRNKMSYKDWVGASSPVRHIYTEVEQDYMGDGYGGYIYIHLGKNRYLQAHIWS